MTLNSLLMIFHDFLQNSRDLEDGAVLIRGSGGTEPALVLGLEQLSDGLNDITEIAQNESHLVLGDPIRVIALLRESPGVAFHEHRQFHGQSLADAARSVLADKEVGEAHVVRNFLGEAFDEHGNAMGKIAEVTHQGFVTAADHNELELETRSVEAPGDFDHNAGPVTAEQNESRGKIGVEAKFTALGGAVDLGRFIEFGRENHTGHLKHMRVIVAERACLPDGPGRAADEILRLALYPEVRRVIGKISEDGDEGRAGERTSKAFAESAVEVGDERDDNIRPFFAPEFFEHTDNRAVIETDDAMHHTEQIGRAERPSVAQHEIVNVLETDGSEAAENVEGIELVLQIHQAAFPGHRGAATPLGSPPGESAGPARCPRHFPPPHFHPSPGHLQSHAAQRMDARLYLFARYDAWRHPSLSPPGCPYARKILARRTAGYCRLAHPQLQPRSRRKPSTYAPRRAPRHHPH